MSLLDRICRADENFLDAIVTLPSLRKLRLSDEEAKIGDLLPAIRSPLEELDVSFIAPVRPPGSLPWLSNLNSTLTTLTIHWAYLRNLNVQCTSVRFLTLETIEPVDTASLVLSFPQLITFYLETGNYDYFDLRADEERALKQRNLETTMQWKRLYDLKGGPVDLYILGLTCPIRYLELQSVHEGNVDRVHSLLDFHRPQVVRMEMYSSTFLIPEIDM